MTEGNTEDDSLWGSEEDHGRFVELANSLSPTPNSAAAVKQTKWVTLTLPNASSPPLKWKEEGKFHLFFDASKYEAECEKLKSFFLCGELPGITKVVTLRESTNRGGISGIPILLYCATKTAKELKEIASCIAEKISYARQRCDRHFPSAIHFKSNDRKIHLAFNLSKVGRKRRC